MAEPPVAECDTCATQLSDTITRRALLAGAAATSAGAALAAAAGGGSAAEAEGTSPDPLPVLVGTVASTGAERVRVDPAQPGRLHADVVLRPGAKVWRLGDAALSDFALGDDISVYGSEAEDGTVLASMVTCDLYSVQGPVRSPGTDSVTIGTTPLRVGPQMVTPATTDTGDEFAPVGPERVPNLRIGAEARALVLRNSRGPGLIWQLGVR